MASGRKRSRYPGVEQLAHPALRRPRVPVRPPQLTDLRSGHELVAPHIPDDPVNSRLDDARHHLVAAAVLDDRPVKSVGVDAACGAGRPSCSTSEEDPARRTGPRRGQLGDETLFNLGEAANRASQDPVPLTRSDVLSIPLAELLGIPLLHGPLPGEAAARVPARRVGRRWLFLRDRLAAAVAPLDDPAARV